jgi:hypothetical protein
MTTFDIRPRLQQGIRLVFLAQAEGFVMAKPAGRIPIVINQKRWLTMKLWEQKKDLWRERPCKPETLAIIQKHMTGDVHGTVTELAKATGLSKPTVLRVMNCLHDENKAYVWDYETGEAGDLRIKIWALGNEEDAVYPPKQTAEERAQRAKERKRKRMKERRVDYEANAAERKRELAKPVVIPARDELTAALFGVAA